MSISLGSIGSSIDDFIQGFKRTKNGYTTRSSQLLGQKGAVWLDVTKARNIYDCIPQVKLVIDRKSSMFSNMEIKHLNSEGEDITTDEMHKLLNNPNMMQSQNEWLKQYKQQEQVYGNQFMYKNKMSLDALPKTLTNVSPAYLTPILTGKFIDQVDIAGIVKAYEYRPNGVTKEKNFESEQIMWSRLTDLDSPVVGVTPFLSLKYPISNIKHAYEYRNVIMSEKGAIGMLKNAGKDTMGSIPIKPEEKARIEAEYLNQFGVGADQRRVILTEANLDWQPMTYPTKDLLLFEEVDANTLTIVDAYGMNINNFSNKSATFENVKQSLIGTYESTIQPEADLFTQKLGEFIDIESISKGSTLVASYNHLKILQKDKESEAKNIESRVKAMDQLVKGGIISGQQAMLMLEEMLGFQFDADSAMITPVVAAKDGDSLEGNTAIQNENAEAQARLRGSVGGVQGILAIQASVSQGITQPAAAIETMVQIYGFDEATARAILGL